jgi:hypothetical protein
MFLILIKTIIKLNLFKKLFKIVNNLISKL